MSAEAIAAAALLRRAPVAVNGSPLWPPVTGVQRVARGLTRQVLVEAGADEVEVLGAPRDFGGRSDAFPGGRVGRVVWEQTGLPVAARRARAILNLGNLAPLATIGSARSLVLTYDLHALRLPGHYRGGWAATYWRMSAAAYRRATWRVTLSRTIAEDLESTLGGHVDAVVPPGIDDAFRPAHDEAVAAIRRRLAIDEPYLVVVGWAQPAKRADLALEAHRRLVAEVPHRLVIVGAERTDFADVELGRMPASVSMAGRLSDPDLAALYSGASGLLFPSQYEGFGLPPVEALACGAPVAASRIPVLEEVLDGLPGVTFAERADAPAWADAAAALLTDAGSPEERSGATLDRYPWEGKGRALLDIVGT